LERFPGARPRAVAPRAPGIRRRKAPGVRGSHGRADLRWPWRWCLSCVQFHPLQTASLAITKQQRQFHAQLARLDTGLHVLMLNTHGMGYLLTEAN